MECIKCHRTLSIDDSMQCILCNHYIHDKCLFNMLSTECREQNMPKYLKLVSHSRIYRSHVIIVVLINALVSNLNQLRIYTH